MFGGGKRRMLQGEVEVTSLTPMTLPLLLILYKCKAMEKKRLSCAICCIFPEQETKDQSMKRHHCNVH